MIVKGVIDFHLSGVFISANKQSGGFMLQDVTNMCDKMVISLLIKE